MDPSADEVVRNAFVRATCVVEGVRAVDDGSIIDVGERVLVVLGRLDVGSGAMTIRAGRLELQGEVPSLFNRPGGCEFHPRCPFADASCASSLPGVTESSDTHSYRCHHPRHLA